MPKITSKSSYFVEEALQSAKQREELAPRYVNVAELEKDHVLWKQMDRFLDELDALNRAVEDTAMSVGRSARLRSARSHLQRANSLLRPANSHL